MTPTRRRYINAALYTATGVVTTFARLHFLAAHPIAQEIVGWVPVLVALAGIGFHLATGDEAVSLPASAVEVAKRVAVVALFVAFPAHAQAPVLAGDVVRVEAVADPGVAVVAPPATTPLVAPPIPAMIPPGAANLSTPVCTPATSKPVPLWAQVIGWAAAAIVEGATLAVTIMQTRPM